jgi:hypothetical protein
MDRPMALPTAPIAAGSLVGGYLVARYSGIRPLGGLVLAAGGVVCAREWAEETDAPTTAALLAIYLAGFGLSHPLARKLGPWPSVLAAAGASGGAAWALADRRA